MLEWCGSHVDQTVAISALILTVLGMVAGAVWWTSCLYAEVHAMRVAIESWTEFKKSVHEDSDAQWQHITQHESRLGKIEARASGLESKADIHDREITHLMESRSG